MLIRVEQCWRCVKTGPAGREQRESLAGAADLDGNRRNLPLAWEFQI